jgi:photosystem II stability/assembly factor-like uncharacterized protein
MKKILLPLLLTYVYFISIDAQWNEIYSLTGSTTYNSIHFPTESIGYIFGSYRLETPHGYGYLMSKTNDGSITWTNVWSKNVSIYLSFGSYKFVSPSIGYRLTNSPNYYSLQQTKDAGLNWYNMNNLLYLNFIEDYTFTNDTTGYILESNFETYAFRLLKYTPDHIDTIFVSNDTIYKKVIFTNDSLGYILCKTTINKKGKWNVLKSSNYGHTWETLLQDSIHTFVSIHFPTDSVGYITTNSNVILKSYNSGNTWITIKIDTTAILKTYCFPDANIGYAFGNNGLIMKTEDGGLNWVRQNSGTLKNFVSIAFPSDSIGYILTEDNKILTTRNFTPLSTKEIDKSFFKIFPNPVTDKLNIQFESNDKPVIDVLNLNCQIIQSFESNTNNFQIDLTGYQKGIYIIRYRSDKFSITEKIIKY